ncbi:MAG: alpha/beta hydrolase, partial [Candidatus Thioglobus sp.]|nr:alpha/beta hydrolase [Candidatus Thioglobus sp.]
MERETYQSSSGSKINLYSLLPIGEVRAVIHITHGMAEHALRYSRFASRLANASYAVFAHDYRGHGFTKANDAPQGVFADSKGFSLVLEDLNEVINLIKQRLPNKPIIC